MPDINILFPSVLNGLTTGAVYALIAVGLTLIYGVLHIINFAHGASLMLALYAVYFLKERWGIDPYMALPIAIVGMFALGSWSKVSGLAVKWDLAEYRIGNSDEIGRASCRERV